MSTLRQLLLLVVWSIIALAVIIVLTVACSLVLGLLLRLTGQAG